jgi:hypothetical protein
MAMTDQALRGRGYPKSVGRTTVSHSIEAMNKRIDDLRVALTHQGVVPSTKRAKGDIVNFRPGIWGLSIDLKELWRRYFARPQ